MNEAIELHDSVLAKVSSIEGSVMLSLRPAYVHRSKGCAGIDAGSGWSQTVTLRVGGGSISSEVPLPATIADGLLRIGKHLYINLIPAGGTFEGTVELRLVFSAAEILWVRGEHLVIVTHGEPAYIEDFNP